MPHKQKIYREALTILWLLSYIFDGIFFHINGAKNIPENYRPLLWPLLEKMLDLDEF